MLAQGSTSPQAYSTTYSSLGAAAREVNLASGVTSCSARHGDVPEGIHPDTWAEIQSTAKKLDVTGNSLSNVDSALHAHVIPCVAGAGKPWKYAWTSCFQV